MSLLVPSAGTHTIDLWMRQDGAQVDRVFLTTSAGTVPSPEPAESPLEPATGGGFAGDLDGDNDVDVADFAIFAANFTGAL